jgi:hypothetical protein
MQSHHHTAQTVGLVVANLAAGAVPAFVVTGTTGVDTSNAGGPETRPRNAYVNYLIKL